MRLHNRRLRIWSEDYLHCRYLWLNIAWAVVKVRNKLQAQNLFVVDAGCGNKPYADLFEGCWYLGINNNASDASPDIIGDTMALPIRSSSTDIVLSSQVIEHVPDPHVMVFECFRVLKPGGFLILTGPLYWPLHEEPLDYYRFTKYGFESLLRNAGFEQWEILPDGGDWAQFFLSINLHLKGRWLSVLRILFNCIGLLLDKVDKKYTCPANYSIIAKKAEVKKRKL